MYCNLVSVSVCVVVPAGNASVLDLGQMILLDLVNKWQYCGPVYIHAIIDAENEIAEPMEDHHHLMAKATIFCDGGMS